MKLHWLEFKNFKLFKNIRVDLSGVRLASIIGRWSDNHAKSNAAAKSSLGDGLLYLLFDHCASSSIDELVTWGCEEEGMEVSGQFEYEGNICKLTRGRNPTARSIKGNFLFWLNGVQQGKNQAEAKQMFADFLGIDVEIAFSTWFFLQGKADKLTDADPARRKEYLASVLKADFEQQYIVAKERLKAAQDQLKDAEAAKYEAAALQAQVTDADSCLDKAVCQERNYDEAEKSALNVLSDVSRKLAIAQEKSKEAAKIPAILSEIEALNVKKNILINKANGIISDDHDRMSDFAEMERKHSGSVAVRDFIDKKRLAIKDRWKNLNLGGDETQWVAEVAMMRQSIVSLQTLAADNLSRLNGVLEVNSRGESICPTCGQQTTAQHLFVHNDETRKKISACEGEIAALQNRLSLFESTYKDIHLDVVEMRSLNSQDHELSAFEIKFAQELGHQAQLRAMAEQSVAQMRSEHDNIVDQIQALKLDVDRLQNVSASGDVPRLLIEESKAKADHEKAVSERMRWAAIVVQWNQHKSALELSLGVQQKRAANVSQLEVSVRVKSAVVDLFHRDGLSLLKIQQAAQLIQHYANEMLVEVLPNYQVSIAVDAKNGKYGSLDFKILTPSGKHPYTAFSGGERKVIDVCLRMSLSRMLSDGAGRTFKTLFLDEVMADLDGVNRPAMMSLIRSLSKNFASIYVISHEKEIQVAFPQTILVERGAAGSQIQVLDTAALS